MPVGAAIFILLQLYDPQFFFFVHAQPTFYGCRKQTLHIIYSSACIVSFKCKITSLLKYTKITIWILKTLFLFEPFLRIDVL